MGTQSIPLQLGLRRVIRYDVLGVSSVLDLKVFPCAGRVQGVVSAIRVTTFDVKKLSGYRDWYHSTASERCIQYEGSKKYVVAKINIYTSDRSDLQINATLRPLHNSIPNTILYLFPNYIIVHTAYGSSVKRTAAPRIYARNAFASTASVTATIQPVFEIDMLRLTWSQVVISAHSY